jgi:murein DD-endopeptidase MepM/ murein hydrolase activator NlpD
MIISIMKKALYTTLLSSMAMGAHAFELGMPIQCNYGTECFIQNYFDEDKSKNYQDYHCGKLSYDGHDGTDFRIRDYVAMKHGVNVIASAAGTVFATRDAMDDINVKLLNKEEISKQGCGNAVVLVHEEGYKTMYCHMKRGSIAVKKGDKVEKGQKLGQVGLSGLTEFPHVHLGVLKEGKKIDPFTGAAASESCGVTPATLWDKETQQKLAYIATGLLSSSFSAAKPEAEEARTGKFSLDKMPADTAALVFWVDMFGLQPGDRLMLTIMSPAQEVLVHKTFDITHNKAVFFQYIGMNKKQAPWSKGLYTGNVELVRAGKPVVQASRQLTVY